MIHFKNNDEGGFVVPEDIAEALLNAEYPIVRTINFNKEGNRIMAISSDELRKLDKWIDEIILLMKTKYHHVFGNIEKKHIDVEAWKSYYDEGLSADDAIQEDLSNA